MKKYLEILVWVMLFGAVALFWISIRSTEDQMYYTAAALVVWGGAFLLNRYVKKQNRGED
ncbi:MAG: hypothetical protein ACFHWX_13040 [Bacteroidota bacterium]